MEKFRGKYRISSARWQNWDYRWANAYFITICTQNRQFYFGDIVSGKMKLSGTGILADVFWNEIKNHAKNIELGEYVIMPNHIHGILVLNGEIPDSVADTLTDSGVDTGHTVETGHALFLPPPSSLPPPPKQQTNTVPKSTIGQQRFQNIGKNSVSSIIGSYKSAVTKHANRLGFEMKWQTLFYDHVIRNKDEYQRIAQYIINNPEKWNEDKFYKNT